MSNTLTLTFGQFNGKQLKDVPTHYIAWLANPTFKKPSAFKVPDDIRAAASEIHAERERELAEATDLRRLLSGQNDRAELIYIVERLGDLSGLTRHLSLGEALDCLDREFPLDENGRDTPNPEDDRILIWEVLATGHKKVVWQFSGWHWDAEEFGIDQGSLPNDEEPLYSIAMADL